MKRFDIENDGNLTGKYPLFFGKALGLFDTANEPYEELVTLDDDQQALFWKANDISLVQDAIDLQEIDPNCRELIIENLTMQMAGDSFANGLISDLFSPILSNNAATSLVSYWSFVESVHAKAYGRMVAEAFPDTNVLLERIKKSEKMLSRLTFLFDTFGEHKTMLRKFDTTPEDYLINPKYYQKTVLKTITALMGLEGIMFLGSFASTFAVCESTQKCGGIDKLVALIHDDEAISHRNNNLAFLDILKNKEEYEAWDETVPEMKAILDGVVKQELDWAVHLFTVCDPLVGFNTELLQDYVLYLSRIIYDHLDIPFDFKRVDVSPFDGWMKNHTQADLNQICQQEEEGANYLTSASTDDLDEMDDFDF